MVCQLHGCHLPSQWTRTLIVPVLPSPLIALTGAPIVLQLHSLCRLLTHCTGRCTHCAAGALIALAPVATGALIVLIGAHIVLPAALIVLPGALIALTGAHCATRCPHSVTRCFMHPHFPGLLSLVVQLWVMHAIDHWWTLLNSMNALDLHLG